MGRIVPGVRPRRAGWLLGCVLLAAGAGAGDLPPAAITAAPGPASLAAPDGAEPQAPSPDEIIARYVQASGGPAIAQIVTERRVGSIVRGQYGKMPVETVACAPGRWRYHQIFSFGDQVVFGCDGDQAWIQDGKSVESMGGQQRLDLQLLIDPQVPLKIREIFPRLELLGGERVGDREAIALRGTSPAGYSAVLVFDRQTGLLLRAGRVRCEDHREVDGVTRPFRLLLGESDEELHLQMTIEFTSTEHNVAVDATVFQRPGHCLPVVGAPLYKEYQEAQVGPEALDACVGVYQHPDKADVTYAVTRWQDHLMLHRTGWPTQREIIPASETEYFIRFPGTEFRFLRDATGRITHLDIANGTIRAARIE